MDRQPYNSDLSDAQWELVRPFVPEPIPNPGEPPHDRREIVNAILYVVRTGVQWRYLPHDYPNWNTTYGYFRAWQLDGQWEKIQEALRPKARLASGRDAQAHLAIIDSQTAHTTECGGPRGYDGNKKILGRKRHLVVDSEGLPITHEITPANVHDSQPAPGLIAEAKLVEPQLSLFLGDLAYRGEPIQTAARLHGAAFEVVTHPTPVKTFVPLPRRWVAERSIAWLGRNRRLSKDYERTIESSSGIVAVASVGILLRRAA